MPRPRSTLNGGAPRVRVNQLLFALATLPLKPRLARRRRVVDDSGAGHDGPVFLALSAAVVGRGRLWIEPVATIEMHERLI